MKVDGSYPSLLQGVSQQPARVRLDGQCSLQENMSSNAVRGLTRRPPTHYVGELFTGANAQFFDFLVDGTTHLLAVSNNDIQVFSTSTVEIATTIASGAGAYLDGSPMVFADMDNKVYVVNKSKSVAMDTTPKTYVSTGSIVFLLGGQYGRKYTITIDWSGSTIVAEYETPDGSASTHIKQIATTYIATQLETDLNADGTFTSNFTVTRVDDVLYIKKISSPATESFSVTVADGEGGTHLYAINNSTSDINRIPKYAPQGYVIKVTGDAGSEADDWYVEFSADPDETGTVPAIGSGFGRAGRWLEATAPNIPYMFNTSTMPHILTYDSGAFTFAQGAWEARNVGDEITNPDPSFVENTIEDVAYFQGRLVFLAGASAIMSRTNKPLDFWFQSATVEADDDPIDIESTAKGVERLYRAVPHNRDLVVFANKAQFVVFGRNTLTPANASLVLTTSFDADFTASPEAAGKVVFFGIKYGQYGGVHEFFTDNTVDTNDARPITQHVNTYLDGPLERLTSTSNFDVLIAQTPDRKVVGVYEYIWKGDQKVQSSWSKWSFHKDIVYAFFVDSRLYLVTHDGKYHLEYLDLDARHDTGIPYVVHLDSKRSEVIAAVPVATPDYYLPEDGATEYYSPDDISLEYYSPADSYPDVTPEVTVVTLPTYYEPSNVVFLQGSGSHNAGLRIPVLSTSGQTVTLDGNYAGSHVIYGVPYLSRYTPTMPMVKDGDGVKLGTAKLGIGKFLVNYEDSGFMQSVKESDFRESVTVDHTTVYTSTPAFLIGEPPISSGTWVVPFRDNADRATITLQSDSHLPLTITSIEWIGQLNKRGQRITGGGR